MTTNELRLKVQALVDNELPEEEIAEVLTQVEGSYELRTEYVELLKLRRRLERISIPEPKREWYDDVAKKAGRHTGIVAGLWVFVGSYLLLLAYAIVSLFRSTHADMWLKIIVAGMGLGFLTLLFITIADRIRESRNDKYKEVIR